MNTEFKHPESPIHVVWLANTSAIVLGRITAADATGEATGVDGEGDWVEQVDIDTITYSIYDLDADDPTTPIVGPTNLTVSDVIIDIPVTDRVLWDKDRVGYNFKHSLPKTSFPKADNRYSLVYHFTQNNIAEDEFFVKYVGRSRDTSR